MLEVMTTLCLMRYLFNDNKTGKNITDILLLSKACWISLKERSFFILN